MPTPRIPDFLWDVVPIIKSEIELLNEGVSCVQIDAPRYSYYLDPKWRDYIRREMGVSPEDARRSDSSTMPAWRVDREGVTLAIHLCRQQPESVVRRGRCDPIAGLFDELDVDLFLLEYDTDRAGTFEPLRFVPPNKGVVLGLVSSKVPALEAQDVLVRRVDDVPICGAAQSRDQHAVRVRLVARGQPVDRRRAMAEAAARRGDSEKSLGRRVRRRLSWTAMRPVVGAL